MFSILVSALGLASLASAQIPNTFNLHEPAWTSVAASHVLPNQDIDYLMAVARNDTSKMWHAGGVNYVDVDLFSEESISQVDNGVLYTTEIYMENALTMAFYFKQFQLPEGSALYILGENDQKFGPFTHETQWEKRDLQTAHMTGNRAQVQYFAIDKDARGAILAAVTTGFQKQMAGSCNINALCIDPSNTCSGALPTSRTQSIQCTYNGGVPANSQFAGTDWANEQASQVAVATRTGSRFCSGAFINNADRKAWVLSAAHCTISSSDIIVYGFINPSCTSTSDTAGDTSRTAGNLRMLHEDRSNSGTDVALVEVGDNVPQSWNVYLSGYDTSNDNPTGAIGLHHPAAANQKISHTSATLDKRAYSGNGNANHWNVAAWQEATTEGGSSGSPLYARDSKRIIGQLHGGSAACPALNGYDRYGGLFASYEQQSFASLLKADSRDGRTLY